MPSIQGGRAFLKTSKQGEHFSSVPRSEICSYSSFHFLPVPSSKIVPAVASSIPCRCPDLHVLMFVRCRRRDVILRFWGYPGLDQFYRMETLYRNHYSHTILLLSTLTSKTCTTFMADKRLEWTVAFPSEFSSLCGWCACSICFKRAFTFLTTGQ